MTDPRLDPADELERLLSESPAHAAARAHDTLAEAVGTADGPFVLFGAGSLGRRVATKLRGLGVEVVAFADNKRSLWGREVEGVPVVSPDEAARRFGELAFVITIWFAGHAHRLEQTRRQLADLGVRRVAAAHALFWRWPEAFLPYFACDLPERALVDAENVRRAFSLLSDAESRAQFVAQLRWRLTLDDEGLPGPRPFARQYFEPDLFPPTPDEFLIDCGAFTGDTFDAFRTFTGDRFAGAWLAEPDPLNYVRLVEHVAGLEPSLAARVATAPVAIGRVRGRVGIQPTGTIESAAGEGSHLVDLVPLDEVAFAGSPTLLKVDIEGAELDVLAGAERLIRARRPIAAIAAYHLQDHLWRIPLLLHEWLTDARFHLRAYSESAFELDCYAVPNERAASPASAAAPGA